MTELLTVDNIIMSLLVNGVVLVRRFCSVCKKWLASAMTKVGPVPSARLARVTALAVYLSLIHI